MSSKIPDKSFKVSLTDPMKSITSGYKNIRVSYFDGIEDRLDVSLRRTLRVPDNGKTYDLPPDCGPLPIYSVNQYSKQLPASMAAKGGVFAPIYQREAVWIKLDSARPFAVKMFVDGVNAITGDSAQESLSTTLHRKRRLEGEKSIQDYIMTGSRGQLWLDGIADLDGKVTQFVVKKAGTGYSVEAQINGQVDVCDIQIEVTPMEYESHVRVKTVAKNYLRVPVNLHTDTVLDVKHRIGRRHDYPVVEARLIFQQRQLQDSKSIFPSLLFVVVDANYRADQKTLADYKVSNDAELQVMLQLDWDREKQDPFRFTNVAENFLNAVKATEMAISPGVFVKQSTVCDTIAAEDWARDKTIMFNLQLLNATTFQHVVGIKAPPTPITAKTYKKYGYPFSKMYNESSGIKRGLPAQSVAQLDGDDDEDLQPSTVDIETSDRRGTFTPVSEMMAKLKKQKIANDS